MQSCDPIPESPFRPPRSWFERRQDSDTEYIEKLRKQVRWLDRWWRWLVAFHLTLFVATVIMAATMFNMLPLLDSVATTLPPQLPKSLT